MPHHPDNDAGPADALLTRLIALCAKAGQTDAAGRQARYDALFSMLRAQTHRNPLLAASWMLAVNRSAPQARPARLAQMAGRALDSFAAANPRMVMILSAQITGTATPGTPLGPRAEQSFQRAADHLLKGDLSAIYNNFILAKHIVTKSASADSAPRLHAYLRQKMTLATLEKIT